MSLKTDTKQGSDPQGSKAAPYSLMCLALCLKVSVMTLMSPGGSQASAREGCEFLQHRYWCQ